MNKEFKFEPCIKFKTVYENSFSNTYGCEDCKTTVRADAKFCIVCGCNNKVYQKQSEYVFDFCSLTNDELYNHHTEDYTYLFSNIRLSGNVELNEDEPFILKRDYIEKSIKSFKEKHKRNIEKVKKVTKDIEICFVLLEKWS